MQESEDVRTLNYESYDLAIVGKPVDERGRAAVDYYYQKQRANYDIMSRVSIDVTGQKLMQKISRHFLSRML
jgi:hypothetical protein